ncbi:MAG TPA: hypothetical protein VF041_23295 [Gemmatimonadaceae bacterium]
MSDEAAGMDVAWAALQEFGRRAVFSRRQALLRELQRRVQQETGAAVAWPDVLWFLTPQIIMAALVTVEDRAWRGEEGER